jgi:hypothetical protein
VSGLRLPKLIDDTFDRPGLLSPRQYAFRMRRALHELVKGRSADDIAKYLDEQYISGVPRSTNVCPIAIYLLLRGAPQGIKVYTDHTRYRVKKGFNVRVSHPPEVQEFILNLDARRYPTTSYEGNERAFLLLLLGTRQRDCQLVG